MSKEKIIDVIFKTKPEIALRVIENTDTKTVKNNKKKYPFELTNTLDITILTTKRKFNFTIFNGYTWNGADIPRFFWRIIGSRTDNDWLVASMVHDWLLEFKIYMLNEVLKNQVTIKEYRRLTSLIFRHIIKEQGTNTLKANVMSWCVDVFQILNRGNWQCQ